MTWFRKCAVILGIVCLIVGLVPWRTASTKTLDDGAVESNVRYTLGIPSSPSLLFEQSETKPGPGVVHPDGTTVYKGGGFHSGASVQFISWSMLFLVLAVLLIDGGTWFKRLRHSLPPSERK
jgi:hypothetical protein